VARTWILIAVAAIGCKNATEKQCDGMFERYEACTGTPFTASMKSAATGKCYVSLGHELEPGDTTSFDAVERTALRECSAINECEALKGCFAKHECRWVLASPGAEPFFACSK
jgi:hypothetical protein